MSTDLDLRILLSAQDTASEVVKSFGGNLAGLTTGAIAVAGAAIAGIGVETVKMAGDFQQGVTKLYTTAGEQKSNLQMVGDGILNMSSSVGTGSQKLVEAMYWIESGGLHGAQGLEALRVAAQAAKAENANLDKVSIALSASINAYAGSGMTAVQIMNTLTAATGQGMMTFEQLSGSLSSVLPASAKFGISLKDVTAALATMTAQGDPAEQAATHLKQVILALEAPSKIGAKALASVGLTSTEVADKMKQNLPDALKMITDAVGKTFPAGSAAYNQAIKNIAGGSKQMMGFLELTGSHMSTFAGNVKTIGGAVKAGGNDLMGWSDIQGNFNFKLDQARAAVEALGIRLGTALLPIMGKVMQGVTSAVTNFTAWETKTHGVEKALSVLGQGFQALVGFITHVVAIGSGIISFFQKNQLALDALGAVLAAVGIVALGFAIAAIPALVVGFIAWAAAAGAAAIATIAATWPIIAIGAVIAAVVFGIILAVQHWGQITAWLQGAWSGIGSWFHGLLTGVYVWFVWLWATIQSDTLKFLGFIGSAIQSGMKAVFDFFMAPINLIGQGFQWLYDHNKYFKLMVDTIVQDATRLENWLGNTWTSVKNAVVGAFKYVWNMAVVYWTLLYYTVYGWMVKAEIFLKGIWDSITSTVSTAAHAVWQKIVDMWTAISTVFGNAWNTYIGKPLGDLWARISKWFADLGTGASNSATNFINMLASGITNGAGVVWNAVVGIASTIWKALGFHSPAKAGPGADADTWMPNLINMLTDGLNAGVPKMQQAVTNVAQPMTQLASPVPARGGASAVPGGGGNHTFNVTVNAPGATQQDAYAIGQVVKQELAKLMRGQANTPTFASGGVSR